ncbi:RICIN domain-containing protein [Actinoplanes sp. NPDC048967]|uniref:RICIN domain-containing protein n=1 Tax=Actinoplanes sp. NPDC048967 TaxID=3155269 RepID=UPI0033FC12EA
MTDRDDEADPLLVRPYLRDEPGGAPPQPSDHTWPEAAAEPVAPSAPDAPPPGAAPAPPPRGVRRHRPLLVLALVVVLAVTGVAAIVWAMLPEPGTRTALPADVPLPSVAVPEPTPATTDPPPAVTARTTPPTRSRSTTSSTPTSAPASTPTRTSPAPARTTTSAPTDRLAPPPADRVGRIHGLGGLCLDLNGAIAVDGNHIQVFTCNETAAQVWTVATDGTLRVVGKCAVAADDGTVRLAGCDGRRSGQWQAGADRTLVALAGGGCLTDPGSGSRSGAGVRIESCSGADRQRWELP